ncbi:MAG TPA: ribbon-helix-helix protein, CopG family [Gemmatimonadales bacterium]|nr:ribbon-helix-helix protein, CopG family [Gemmatimonadales bacterium]
MTKPPLERVTITIPQPLLAAADALAERMDRSRSWVLAEAVRRMVSAEGGVPPTRLPEICRALARTESRYLVLAPIEELQGPPLPRPAVALLIRRDLENAVRVLAGLESAGYPHLRDWLPEQLLDKPSTAVSGQPQLLLHSSLGGKRYDEVDARAGQVVLGGVRIPVIAGPDLQQLESILRRPES